MRETGKSAFWKSMGILLPGIQAGLTQEALGTIKSLQNGAHRPITEQDLDIFRVQFIDQKPEQGAGEYGRLREAMFGNVIRPGVDGYNPFDPSMSDLLGMTEIAINLAETAEKRALVNYEPLALQIAVSTMYSNARQLCGPELLISILSGLSDEEIFDFQKQGKQRLQSMVNNRREMLASEAREQHLDDVPAGFAYVESLVSRDVTESNIDPAAVRRDAGLMAAAMTRLTQGDFGRITGDAPSVREQLRSHLLVVERLNMSPAASIVWDGIWAKWQTQMIEQNQTSYIPNLRVGDEEADAYNSIMYLRFRDEQSRKSRAIKTWNVNLVQFGERLAHAGDPESETRKLARAIQLGISQRIIGAMPYDDDVLDGLTQYGMSDADAHTITGLPVGCFAYKAMNKSVVFFQHILTSVAAKIVPSNAATEEVLDRYNVWSFEEVQRRATEKEKLKGKTQEREEVA
jgi:hypothetical protein